MELQILQQSSYSNYLQPTLMAKNSQFILIIITEFMLTMVSSYFDQQTKKLFLVFPSFGLD